MTDQAGRKKKEVSRGNLGFLVWFCGIRMS